MNSRSLALILAGIALLAAAVVWRKSSGTPPPTAASPSSAKPAAAQPQSVGPKFRKPSYVRQSAIPPEFPMARFRNAPGTNPLTEATVEERMEFNRELLNQGPAELFKLWSSEAGRMNDKLKLEFISDVLSLKLREPYPEAGKVYASVDAFIQNGENDAYLRCHLVAMLGETATPEALQILLRLAQKEPESSPLRPVALHQVARIGDSFWGNRSHPELAPLVDQAWQEPGADEWLTGSLARALARLGTPSSVDLLLKEVLQAGATVQEFEQKDSDRAWTAFDALGEVANPVCIPMLEARLVGGSPERLETVAVGYALASMGHPDATQALLKWIQAAPRDVGPFVQDWLSKVRDDTSHELVEAAVKSPGSFAVGENHRVLIKLLKGRTAPNEQ